MLGAGLPTPPRPGPKVSTRVTPQTEIDGPPGDGGGVTSKIPGVQVIDG